MLTFTPITLEHHALLRKYYAGCDYRLCEYSAGTKLMWSLYLRPSFAAAADWALFRLSLARVKAKCYKENAASYKMLSACMRPAGEDETFFYFEKTV